MVCASTVQVDLVVLAALLLEVLPLHVEPQDLAPSLVARKLTLADVSTDALWQMLRFLVPWRTVSARADAAAPSMAAEMQSSATANVSFLRGVVLLPKLDRWSIRRPQAAGTQSVARSDEPEPPLPQAP